MRGVIFLGVGSLDSVGTWGYEKLGNDDVLPDPLRQEPHFVHTLSPFRSHPLIDMLSYTPGHSVWRPLLDIYATIVMFGSNKAHMIVCCTLADRNRF
jgi:hypothetical protein